MKHLLTYISLLVVLTLFGGCTDKLLVDGGNIDFDEGHLTECKLGLTVGDFAVSNSTRAADPDDIKDTATEQESKIDNIWVFQYNESGSILIKPRYYTMASKDTETGNWLVLLKDGVKNTTIYVVANTNDSTWAQTLTDFDTLDKLKAQTLPNPDPIIVSESSDFLIPMQGSVTEATSVYGRQIDVAVERMFAKLIISAKMVKDSMNLMSIEVNNIPWTCRVASRSCADTDADAEKVAATDYPTASSSWITRSLNTKDIDTGAVEDNDKLVKPTTDYVLYIPENIQGEVDDADKMAATNIPAYALTVRYHLDVNIPDEVEGSETATLQGEAEVFPGGNTTTNFNIKRNRVYKITGAFRTTGFFIPSPASNCFIVKPGESLVFWPYYRLEKGGGYDIKDYLNPTVDSLAIDSVKILWQDKNVIGDNSNYDKVTWTSDINSGSYDYQRDHFKIRVKTQSEGNALIAAYNKKGEIVWSWHIWVTGNDPGNVGNAIRYTTYEWDLDSIHTDKRVPGYQVMPCNLGAKAFEDTGRGKDGQLAKGLLYQWGRKDPFPPIISNSSTYNNAAYNDTNVGIHYANDNSTNVGKTSNVSDTTKLFHSEYSSKVGTIKYAIQHPTVFLRGVDNSSDYRGQASYTDNDDWLKKRDNKLWGALDPEDPSNIDSLKVAENGNGGGKPYAYVYRCKDGRDFYGEKSIFDPSPTGWRVPSNELWMGFTKNGANPTGVVWVSYLSTLDEWKYWVNFDPDRSNNYGMYMYLEGWQSGSGSYFPTQGLRRPSGNCYRGEACGNYHCASAASHGLTFPLHVHHYLTYPSPRTASSGRSCHYVSHFNVFECGIPSYHKRAVAGPIRCVRDRR